MIKIAKDHILVSLSHVPFGTPCSNLRVSHVFVKALEPSLMVGWKVACFLLMGVPYHHQTWLKHCEVKRKYFIVWWFDGKASFCVLYSDKRDLLTQQNWEIHWFSLIQSSYLFDQQFLTSTHCAAEGSTAGLYKSLGLPPFLTWIQVMSQSPIFFESNSYWAYSRILQKRSRTITFIKKHHLPNWSKKYTKSIEMRMWMTYGPMNMSSENMFSLSTCFSLATL